MALTDRIVELIHEVLGTRPGAIVGEIEQSGFEKVLAQVAADAAAEFVKVIPDAAATEEAVKTVIAAIDEVAKVVRGLKAADDAKKAEPTTTPAPVPGPTTTPVPFASPAPFTAPTTTPAPFTAPEPTTTAPPAPSTT